MMMKRQKTRARSPPSPARPLSSPTTHHHHHCRPASAKAQPSVAIPPQLRSIIRKELAAVSPAAAGKDPIHVMVRSIEQAKQNELKAYLTLCQVRLQIPSKAPSPSQQ
jgi:hypothetical protein